MRFFVLSLFIGLALGSPIGQVADEQATTVVPEGRSDILADATTVVVEILSDDVVTTSATQRARQAGGEDEDGSDEEEATTVASSGSGNSAGRIRPPPAIPQPAANASDFLAEYQFSSQFNLGPKEALPVAGSGVAGAAPLTIGQQPAIQVAETPVVPPNIPPAVPPVSALSNAQPSTPTIVAAGEDEDEAESDEDATQAPSARQQQQEAQRVEESDSDNEIVNDDVTTVKSFASEYEYTVQQLNGEKRVPS